jgi:hypothetical protein
VHVTHDIIWLRRMFYTTKVPEPEIAIKPTEAVDQDNDDDDDEDLKDMPPLIPQNQSSGESDDEDDNSSDEEESNNEDEMMGQATTRSGCNVNIPERYREPGLASMTLEELDCIDFSAEHVQAEIAAAAIEARDFEPTLSGPEITYYKNMADIEAEDFSVDVFEDDEWVTEYAAAGTGIGMKYSEAVHGPDKKKWTKAVQEEHNQMLKFGVWEAVRRKDVSAATKIITSTWAMKKKASGTYRARLNAQGFEQREGLHYDGSSISAPPVSNEMVIRVVSVLMIVANWVGEILDVQGAFLHGRFDYGETIHMKVPQGFEKHYDPMYYVLLLLKTIYRLKQSAFQFWKAILLCFALMGFKRSKSDPCLYYKWSTTGLVLWVSWIDDCLVLGHQESVNSARKKK